MCVSPRNPFLGQQKTLAMGIPLLLLFRNECPSSERLRRWKAAATFERRLVPSPLSAPRLPAAPPPV